MTEPDEVLPLLRVISEKLDGVLDRLDAIEAPRMTTRQRGILGRLQASSRKYVVDEDGIYWWYHNEKYGTDVLERKPAKPAPTQEGGG